MSALPFPADEPGTDTRSPAHPPGLPVIASRLGPLAEWVRDGEAGLLVEPGQPQALADAADAEATARRLLVDHPVSAVAQRFANYRCPR